MDNKTNVILYLLFSLTYPIKKIIIPHYFGVLISELIESNQITEHMKKIVIMVVGLWILTVLLSYIMHKIDKKVLPKLQSYFRQELIKRVISANAETDVNLNVGAIVTNISSISYIVENLANEIRDIILPTMYTLIGSVIYFSIVNIKLGAIYATSVIIFILTMIQSIQKYIDSSSKTSEEYTKIFESISDLLYNVINIYTAGTLKDEIKLLESQNNYYNSHYEDTIDAQSKFQLKFKVSFMAVIVITITYTLYLFKKGTIDSQKVVSILIVSMYVMSQVDECDDSIPYIAYNIGMLLNTEQELGRLEKLQKKNPDSITVDNGDIRIEGLSVDYGNQELNNINLHIPSKHITAIRGHNGSGKTTLVTSILKLHDYTGDIFIDNQNIKTVDTETLRKYISFIPQEPKLFNRSIYDNIAYGSNVSKEQIMELLRSIGLNSFFYKDLDKPAGKNGSNLSGGQRQLVMVLRALFLQVPILILDEPTNALDVDIKKYLFLLLQRLKNQCTIIIITHDQDLLKIVDNVITLDNGYMVN